MQTCPEFRGPVLIHARAFDEDEKNRAHAQQAWSNKQAAGNEKIPKARMRHETPKDGVSGLQGKRVRQVDAVAHASNRRDPGGAEETTE